MIKVVSAYYEMHLCPMVVIGRTDTGATVYARFRWGHLSVRIDPRDDPPHGGATGEWIIDELVGDDQLAGWIEYDELRAVTKDRIEWPAEVDERPRDDHDDRDDGGGDSAGDGDDLRRFFS